MTIILDMGSGETCKNDIEQVTNMIDAVDRADPRDVEIILKWQLFRGGEFSHLKALHPGVFAYAYDTARKYGYATTASVFDYESVRFIENFNIPFLKIACVESSRRMGCAEYSTEKSYWRKPFVYSFSSQESLAEIDNVYCYGLSVSPLCCVREYPATVEQYVEGFTCDQLNAGISDHTDHSDHSDPTPLLMAYMPKLYETHFCLDSQTGPDTGPFALRPNQLRDMLEAL